VLNGESVNSNISHEALKNGGKLEFKLTSYPASMSLYNHNLTANPKRMVMIPFLKSGEKAFIDSTYIEMHCYTPDAVIRFTNDGSEPTEMSQVYKRPFYAKQSLNLNIKGFHRTLEPSFTESVSFINGSTADRNGR
jgi:hypothetical protein